MGFLRRRQPEHPPEAAADVDARLVAWARQDPQAFTALYDRYFPAVYGYCLSQLGDPGAAEDAASQTFLKALAALPRYREAGRFRPWLFAIAHNAVLDAIGRRRPDAPLEEAAGVLDPAASPEERAIAALDAAWLDGAIARLPGDDRRVLELRRAGLSGREIADVLGIGHEAAKKRQLRALDRLRADLAADLAAAPAAQEVRNGA
jgi:RNA polymerase sigma-70 factor (ECF subfamily)